ncbi:MAG: hypothetical protein U0904_11905 [Candidatus Nanopelagicales bacterium]|nr:hypothetical protein [Candidatus Nanopelagicales bacterium]
MFFRDDIEQSVWNPGDDVSGYKLVEPGDFVVGLRSFQFGLSYSQVRGLVSPAYTVFRAWSPQVERRFFRWLFVSTWFVSHLDNISQGIRQGRTIDYEAMSDLRLPVPPLDDQTRIADYLDAETARLDALIAKKRRLESNLAERDESLIDALFGPRKSERMTRLGRFARVQSGLTIDSGRITDKDSVTLPYLRVANVQAGVLDLSEIREVRVPTAQARRALLRPGDVLMTEGGDLDKLGRGTVWAGAIDPCLHQNHVFAVRVDSGFLLPSYLALLTRSSHARAYFESTGVRSTNLASTSSTKLLDLPVPVTLIDDQQVRLIAYAEGSQRINGCCARLNRQIELLAERRQALITAAVTGEFQVPESAA